MSAYVKPRPKPMQTKSFFGDLITGAIPGLVTGNPLAAVAGGLMGTFGGGGAAAGQAQELTDAQRALLEQAAQWGTQYGPGALQMMWNLVQNPYEDAFSRNVFARERQNIESGYRPVYAQGIQNLARRGLSSQYGSQPGRLGAGIDRARGAAVAQAAMGRAATQSQEQLQRLSQFRDMLASLRGQNVQGAGGYAPLSQMYAQMAQQQGAAQGDILGNLMLLQMLMNQGRGGGGAGGGGNAYLGDVTSSPYG